MHVLIYDEMTLTSIYIARVEGTRINFRAPADMTLLQAAELGTSTDLNLKNSCRNGTCRTCICRLTQGEVAYRIDWPGLSINEKRDGFILPCVAYPVTDVVIQLID